MKNYFRRTLPVLFVLFSMTLVIVSCGASSSKPSTKVDQVLSFDADSAYQYIADQTNFGPRIPDSKGHDACRDYIVSSMKKFGASVSTQACTPTMWDGSKIHATNIIANYLPEKTNRILLCAHWDTRPWADQDKNPANHHKPIDGANDGASGVGVLMEIARQIQLELSRNNQPSYGVDLVFFDAEDLGTPSFMEATVEGDFWCLGTQYWAKNARANGYKANFGILLDMVGGKAPSFMWDTYSKQYAPKVLENVWNIAAKLGYSNFFIPADGGSITDDHVAVNQIAGIPCIDIIDFNPASQTGFPSTWHTLDDNMQHIDKNTLKAVGETIMHVLFTN